MKELWSSVTLSLPGDLHSIWHQGRDGEQKALESRYNKYVYFWPTIFCNIKIYSPILRLNWRVHPSKFIRFLILSFSLYTHSQLTGTIDVTRFELSFIFLSDILYHWNVFYLDLKYQRTYLEKCHWISFSGYSLVNIYIIPCCWK